MANSGRQPPPYSSSLDCKNGLLSQRYFGYKHVRPCGLARLHKRKTLRKTAEGYNSACEEHLRSYAVSLLRHSLDEAFHQRVPPHFLERTVHVGDGLAARGSGSGRIIADHGQESFGLAFHKLDVL